MYIVDIILPLPLEKVFSYSVPNTILEKIKIGVRVLVPFGKSKLYVGICNSMPKKLTENENKEIHYKNIITILDNNPILLPQQLKLWYWISNYYMSTLGDVYKAALPAGLKSEDNYKPKMETFIRLHPNIKNTENLNIAINSLKNIEKQKKVFSMFLSLSKITYNSEINNRSNENTIDISKEELLNESNCSISVLNGLIKKEFLQTYKKEIGRLNDKINQEPQDLLPLNKAQTTAYNELLKQMDKHNVTLLHGVTSSGKTEIYLHLIDKTIKEKKQVLYLLPEIALTIQIMERIKRVFGNKLGIYHSKYSDAERVEIWQKQLSDKPYDIILGARSAVFMPFKNLGLVIIDEEHETSFKQQEPAPRYHARSAAIILAQLYKAKVLLGTATPSVESYYNAQQGKYGLVTLTQRYKDIKLPNIKIIDVKDLYKRKMMVQMFSPELLAAMQTALEHNEQIILFQNQRGYAPMVECNNCGWIPKCPNCDISLTYHKNMNSLTCHYCGYITAIPTICPKCANKNIKNRGFGTEKIENEIKKIFPAANVSRMDLDTTKGKNAYERLIHNFSSGKSNILIGTQMISKGLDFDNVSVVGIIDANRMLNLPDFRAYEMAFMIMTRVSGRAGRKGKQGQVILQTKSTDLPVIKQVVNYDYKGFYNNLIEERKEFHYPPFYRLIYVYIKHRNDNIVNSASLEMGTRLREIFGKRVLGPDKPSVSRIKELNIRKIILKLENGIKQTLVRKYLKQERDKMLQDKHYGALTIYYDVDPL